MPNNQMGYGLKSGSVASENPSYQNDQSGQGPDSELNSGYSENNFYNPDSKDQSGRGQYNVLNKKPSVKTIVLAVVFLIIFIGGSIYFWKNSNLLNPVKPPEKVDNLDSDYDGLPDRIEKLLKTNPNNWDTDGDGYSDAREIKKGYNPLLPGSAKLSSEEWNAIKEKIKTAGNDFYNIFFDFSPEKNGDFSSPENTFEIFAKAIKQNNQDLFFSALGKESIKSLNMKDTKGNYINNLSMSEMVRRMGLDNPDETKYNLIDQNDRFARMAPLETAIKGEKETITYKNIDIDKKVTITKKSVIYMKKEDGFWKIDIIMSMEDTIYRNSNNASEEARKEMDDLRNYWMGGLIGF